MLKNKSLKLLGILCCFSFSEKVFADVANPFNGVAYDANMVLVKKGQENGRKLLKDPEGSKMACAGYYVHSNNIKVIRFGYVDGNNCITNYAQARPISMDSGNAFYVNYKVDGSWVDLKVANEKKLIEGSKASIQLKGSVSYPAYVTTDKSIGGYYTEFNGMWYPFNGQEKNTGDVNLIKVFVPGYKADAVAPAATTPVMTGFDAETYLGNYLDLQKASPKDGSRLKWAENHYNEYGKNEKRIADRKLAKPLPVPGLPEDFDADQYLANYKDLQDASKNEADKQVWAGNHYKNFGLKENRSYKVLVSTTPVSGDVANPFNGVAYDANMVLVKKGQENGRKLLKDPEGSKMACAGYYVHSNNIKVIRFGYVDGNNCITNYAQARPISMDSGNAFYVNYKVDGSWVDLKVANEKKLIEGSKASIQLKGSVSYPAYVTTDKSIGGYYTEFNGMWYPFNGQEKNTGDVNLIKVFVPGYKADAVAPAATTPVMTGFDAETYLGNYLDLQKASPKDGSRLKWAENHYNEYGKNEKRIADRKLAKPLPVPGLPEDFDADQYLANYKDLQDASKNEADKQVWAGNHYKNFGLKENRSYKVLVSTTPVSGDVANPFNGVAYDANMVLVKKGQENGRKLLKDPEGSKMACAGYYVHSNNIKVIRFGYVDGNNCITNYAQARPISMDSGNAFYVNYKVDGSWVDLKVANEKKLIEGSKASIQLKGSVSYPAYVTTDKSIGGYYTEFNGMWYPFNGQEKNTGDVNLIKVFVPGYKADAVAPAATTPVMTGFDAETYLGNYLDLQKASPKDGSRLKWAENHYNEYGKNEKRIADRKLAKPLPVPGLPEDFDADQYLANYKDLQDASKNEADKQVWAGNHYKNFGLKENRSYKVLVSTTPVSGDVANPFNGVAYDANMVLVKKGQENGRKLLKDPEGSKMACAGYYVHSNNIKVIRFGYVDGNNCITNYAQARPISMDSGNAFYVNYKVDGSWVDLKVANEKKLIDGSKASIQLKGSVSYPAYVTTDKSIGGYYTEFNGMWYPFNGQEKNTGDVNLIKVFVPGYKADAVAPAVDLGGGTFLLTADELKQNFANANILSVTQTGDSLVRNNVYACAVGVRNGNDKQIAIGYVENNQCKFESYGARSIAMGSGGYYINQKGTFKYGKNIQLFKPNSGNYPTGIAKVGNKFGKTHPGINGTYYTFEGAKEIGSDKTMLGFDIADPSGKDEDQQAPAAVNATPTPVVEAAPVNAAAPAVNATSTPVVEAAPVSAAVPAVSTTPTPVVEAAPVSAAAPAVSTTPTPAVATAPVSAAAPTVSTTPTPVVEAAPVNAAASAVSTTPTPAVEAAPVSAAAPAVSTTPTPAVATVPVSVTAPAVNVMPTTSSSNVVSANEVVKVSSPVDEVMKSVENGQVAIASSDELNQLNKQPSIDLFGEPFGWTERNKGFALDPVALSDKSGVICRFFKGDKAYVGNVYNDNQATEEQIKKANGKPIFVCRAATDIENQVFKEDIFENLGSRKGTTTVWKPILSTSKENWETGYKKYNVGDLVTAKDRTFKAVGICRILKQGTSDEFHIGNAMFDANNNPHCFLKRGGFTVDLGQDEMLKTEVLARPLSDSNATPATTLTTVVQPQYVMNQSASLPSLPNGAAQTLSVLKNNIKLPSSAVTVMQNPVQNVMG
jgi:hypothetical protein